MTKTFLTVGLVSSFALLSACATGTDYKSSEKSVSETPAEKVAMKDAAMSTELCTDMGPQTPRDISNTMGKNLMDFVMAPASTEMNLCNIHTHTNAEHKGPGFSVFVNDTDYGGYACNDAANLTATELFDPYQMVNTSP